MNSEKNNGGEGTSDHLGIEKSRQMHGERTHLAHEKNGKKPPVLEHREWPGA